MGRRVFRKLNNGRTEYFIKISARFKLFQNMEIHSRTFSLKPCEIDLAYKLCKSI